MSFGSVGCGARFALILGISTILGGCSRSQKARTDADASAEANANVAADGHALVVAACLSCHSEPMLAQQRLTQAQWTKVIGKMVGWGAILTAAEAATVVAYLSSSYGPDAGAYEPEVLSAAEAVAELAATSDDPFPLGDAARGGALFAGKCAECHGEGARGHVGVALIDRPFLYRAADFARTVRLGRGRMKPLPLSDAEIGDVLAHLRSLRTLPP